MFFTFIGINTSFAQSKQIKVKVDGLSCPFCAYGLEKNFKKIDGVSDIKINIKKGTLSFAIQKGKTISEEQIKKKVEQAGFTPREITYPKMAVKKEK